MHTTDESLATPQIHQLRAHLHALYPAEQAATTLARLLPDLEHFADRYPQFRASASGERVDQSDVVLITYGDQVQEPGKPPLQSLDEFLAESSGDFLSGVHILPFFPYTSDDGFSVVDFLQVDPALGSWAEIEHLAGHSRLMADAVINHISVSSPWFQGFRAGDPRYADYFIAMEPESDLKQVVRPRALPLLTPVQSTAGVKHVWTTFSEDQVDLNYANPELLLEMTQVLLTYVAHGVQMIRLDAIAYLWKEPGTSCIHLDRTHRVVQFWRTVLDMVAPRTLLITETNVPHLENVSYFGDGTNEAQLVYQFSLPPLLLHAIHHGDARVLQRWAATLSTPSDQTTFFNFLASHDGIGVRPAEGLLSQAQILELARRAEAHGGYVSYKSNPDGSQSPYELNINYFDALNDPRSTEPPPLQVDRFMVAQAILLGMAGVPGIYIHSLFGSRGWPEGAQETGRYRTINRRKFQRAELEAALRDPTSRRRQVFDRYRSLIRVRTAERAFHPQGVQAILPEHPALFSFVRIAPDQSSRVLCIHNVSAQSQPARFDLAAAGFSTTGSLTELIMGQPYQANGTTLDLTVPPYGVLWLREGGT